MSVEVWLVRHGETVWNAEGRLTGWSDVPLSALGKAQARALSYFLTATPFDCVFSSDLQRAVHTAHLAYGKTEHQLTILRELNFGLLEGMRWSDLAEPYQTALLAFDGLQAPGGESTADFRARIYAFLETLPPGRHLVFSHGGVLRLILRDLGQDQAVLPCVVAGVDWTKRKLLFLYREEKQHAS